MNFLIAPNALKGSLSALRAANTISQSLKGIAPDVATLLCPIADGGDGTLECLVQATGGKVFEATVRGPVSSLRVNARWGVLGDGATAVIEMAEAAGLRLLSPPQYDIANATTYGVGELILQALKSGFKKIIVGLGGSATNDGGAGCARALGIRFFDEHNKELPQGGIHLARLHHLEIKNYELGPPEADAPLAQIKNAEIIGLADVTNVLYGPAGAAHTFAAQKGASNDLVVQLDEGMRHYASIIERETHHKVSTFPGSGAAGGLGAGLMAFCNARIVSGIDFVLDTVRFDSLLQQYDCVITAEGMIDSQTLRGKGIEGVARRARKFNKPVHAFVGRIHGDATALQKKLGLATLHQISPDKMTLEDAMRGAESLLALSIRDFFTSNFTKDSKK
jgi:glycerate kinase